MAFKGRSIPSKMLSSIPGPRVAHSAPPVPYTGSPVRRPVVFSYTWMVVFWSLMPMTSPTNRSSPTSTISIMDNPVSPSRVTTGPLMP